MALYDPHHISEWYDTAASRVHWIEGPTSSRSFKKTWHDRASRARDVEPARLQARTLRHAACTHIDPLNGTANFRICLGEMDWWGKGFGAETTRLTLKYGFEVLGLRGSGDTSIHRGVSR